MALDAAVAAFFATPINAHGTPYVAIPEDFTAAEQAAFVALIDEDRLVSRDEQIGMLRAIRDARRTNGMSDLTALVRRVAARVETGDAAEATRAADVLREALAARGLAAGCHVGVAGGAASLSAAQVVEWYAGQFVAIADAGAWHCVNSWLNCVDKFAPEPQWTAGDQAVLDAAAKCPACGGAIDFAGRCDACQSAGPK